MLIAVMLILAQPPSVPGPPCVPGIVAASPVKTHAQRYAEATAESVASGKPMAVFVGCQPVTDTGVLVLGVPENWFVGFPAKCVLVGVPDGQKVMLKATLDCGATVAQIRQAADRCRIPFLTSPQMAGS